MLHCLCSFAEPVIIILWAAIVALPDNRIGIAQIGSKPYDIVWHGVVVCSTSFQHLAWVIACFLPPKLVHNSAPRFSPWCLVQKFQPSANVITVHHFAQEGSPCFVACVCSLQNGTLCASWNHHPKILRFCEPEMIVQGVR